jgi:F0F1-type ATP synthase assembly protein I
MTKTRSDEEKLLQAVAFLNAKVLGLILGILLGLVIFIATNWLLIKGPQVTESGRQIVGPHLQLLSQFFIGYKVSFSGSIIGFLYGFAIGTISGSLIGWLYNRIVNIRHRL